MQKILEKRASHDFSVHATGFSQWLMTEFGERRIHSAENAGGRIS